jgi:hypothetical protein
VAGRIAAAGGRDATLSRRRGRQRSALSLPLQMTALTCVALAAIYLHEPGSDEC